MRCGHERHGGGDKDQNDHELDRDDHVVDARGFTNADDQQYRNGDDHQHRRNIDDRAGGTPDMFASVVGKRRIGEFVGHDDADIFQEAHDIARPADGDGDGAERIFQDQVPADDPGDEFAQGRVRIRVGAARDRNGRGHFRIAQAGERAGKGAEHEGQRDGRPRIGRRRMSGEDENAGADNGADAERHQIERRQGALERHAVVRGECLHLGFFSFRQQYRKRFAHPDIRHDLPPL